jgi:hypothetical protein
LTFCDRSFVHSDSPSKGAFDGPVSFNRKTLTANVAGGVQGEEEDVFEEVFEFGWEAVERVEVEQGTSAFPLSLLSPC